MRREEVRVRSRRRGRGALWNRSAAQIASRRLPEGRVQRGNAVTCHRCAAERTCPRGGGERLFVATRFALKAPALCVHYSVGSRARETASRRLPEGWRSQQLSTPQSAKAVPYFTSLRLYSFTPGWNSSSRSFVPRPVPVGRAALPCVITGRVSTSLS